MKSLVALLCLAAGAAAAQDSVPEPGVCPVAANTITFDLGYYRGAYLATHADGSKLGHSGWQFCPPQPTDHREHAWEGCNFSLCDLPDGAYQLRLADPPAPVTFSFSVKSRQITLMPSDAGQQVGFYGVDASDGHRPVALDLQGYTLGWTIAHWAGPFQGTATHGHAATDGHVVQVSLYPGIPYVFHFGASTATLSRDKAGMLTVGPAGGPLAVAGRVARLRVGAFLITPPGAGAWSIDGVSYSGPQTVALPAGDRVTLTQGDTVQNLALDAACTAGGPAGPFTVAATGGGKSCGQ